MARTPPHNHILHVVVRWLVTWLVTTHTADVRMFTTRLHHLSADVRCTSLAVPTWPRGAHMAATTAAHAHHYVCSLVRAHLISISVRR